jgi:RNA polymerase sigma-70 factor (ECF subfamily)
MTSSKAETKLVARAAKGDREAFGRLYEIYLDAIYRYLYHRVSVKEDAEDLTELVFLKAWENLAGYRPQHVGFRAWLYRIAHNALIDHYRARRESDPLEEHHAIQDVRTDAEDHLVAEEDLERLTRTIVKLEPDHQHVLVLRFIEGLKPGEVADILNLGEGAVRVMQHRALKALAALMAVEEVTSG